MSSRFFAVIVVALGILGGVFFLTQDKAASPPANNNGGQATSNHVQGEGTSGVVLIEYGDFECPACGAYFPMLLEVKDHFKDQIAFQFRHFPLVQIHPKAMAAHRAAEAAGKQGKFFEMHDLLYQRQQLWISAQNGSTIFESYAQELGLNMEQFKADVAAEATLSVITADIQAGQKAGATATPTFILDGKKIDENPRTVEDFIKLIEEVIKAKTTGSNQ